jgi:YHS domain-containing protein
MKNSWIVGLFAFVVAFATVSIAADSKVAVDKLKCLVAGTAAAKEDKSSDWKDGKVYFCCGNCLKKFDADKKAFAAKANHQLIASKQVEQKSCPFSGGDLNKDTAIEFKGASISFCCNNCKGKAEKMSDDDKVAKLFGEEAYAKAKFAKVETK